MSYYEKRYQQTVQRRWNEERSAIVDPVAVAEGDEITQKHRPTWNDFGTLLNIVEVMPSLVLPPTSSNPRCQNGEQMKETSQIQIRDSSPCSTLRLPCVFLSSLPADVRSLPFSLSVLYLSDQKMKP